MNFLLTNDDGITSPGLAAIVEVMTQYGRVFVVSPNQDKSAVGHSITFRESLKVRETNVFGEHVKAWTVNGTPADCVKMALDVLVPGEIDFVVSGMNIGSNVGRDSYYSGTIAGAREATYYGIPAVAVSLDIFGVDYSDFTEPKKLFANVMDLVLSGPLPKDLLLNVNLPNLKAEKHKGIQFAELDYSVQRYGYRKETDQTGETAYWLQGLPTQLTFADLQGDFALLEEGYVTVTPLAVQLTHEKRRTMINQWVSENLMMQQKIQSV